MRESHAHQGVDARQFDIVSTEIKTSLYHLDVPQREMDEFLALIEKYRAMVVGVSTEEAEAAAAKHASQAAAQTAAE